jgi:inner membrane transporter RhtA
MLALLPATAVTVGVAMLSQVSTLCDMVGVMLVIVGIVIHKPAETP